MSEPSRSTLNHRAAMRREGLRRAFGRHVVTVLVATVAGVGCARVEPARDFQTASAITAERNESSVAYDPQADALVADKVRALLKEPLTIDEAVTVALLNNPSFQAEFQSIGASRADVVQAGLLTNPSLFFSVRFPEAGGRSSLNFSFAQQLVDLWQIPVRKQVAEADLARTVSTVVDRGVQLAAEVRSQCVRVLALERTEGIANDNLDLTQQALSLAEARLNAGESGPIDASLFRSRVFEAEQILIAVRRDRRTAELELARLLGLVRWPDAWALHGSLELAPPEPQETDALVRIAEAQRFDIRIVSSQVASAEAQLEREYLEIFPNITLGMEAERPDRRALPGRKILADTARASTAAGQPTAPSIQSKGDRDLARRQIVDSLLGPSVQITLPVWDQNQAQIAKSKYTVIQLRKQYESILDQVVRDVHQAQITAAASQELVESFESKSLPQARENVDIVRRQYESGEQSIILFIESQEFLLDQNRAYVDALRARALAVAELKRAVGGRLPERSDAASPPSSAIDESESTNATDSE